MDTSSFDALRFLEGLVGDSRELARFRKNREQYLAEHGCPPEARDVLLALPLNLEISTVIDLRSNLPFTSAAPADTGVIDLSGQEVTLTTSDRIFLAEGTGPEGVTCLLLEDSYFTYDPKAKTPSFCLNIAYTYPQSINTYVAVFNVRCNASGDEPGNLGTGTVRLTVQDYALLKQFNPTRAQLGPGSLFDPATGAIFLDLVL
ncbi:MAG TPA: hypothetical protein VFS21_21115 [Roseiflexaceae bacterium]|nr:hypothetical protein [Roseiflexaceae bacterium]